MATSSRRQAVALTEQLQSEPYRFDFFQAVRLLRRMAREQSPDSAREPVGEDHSPQWRQSRAASVP